MRKLDRFIKNARIKGTDHVLEIETGWVVWPFEQWRRPDVESLP